ncbi:uncharacterized protein LOC100398245 isoform X2 [Callithrix jacchus]
MSEKCNDRITDLCKHIEELSERKYEIRFCHVGQPGLQFLTSGDSPALASQVLGLQSKGRMVYHNRQIKKDSRSTFLQKKLDIEKKFYLLGSLKIFSKTKTLKHIQMICMWKDYQKTFLLEVPCDMEFRGWKTSDMNLLILHVRIYNLINQLQEDIEKQSLIFEDL